MGVGEDLNLNVARLLDNLFYVDFRTIERRKTFGLRRLECWRQLVGIWHLPHSFAASTGRGFEHNWIAKLGCQFVRFVDAPQSFRRSWHHRYTGFDSGAACGRF